MTIELHEIALMMKQNVTEPNRKCKEHMTESPLLMEGMVSHFTRHINKTMFKYKH